MDIHENHLFIWFEAASPLEDYENPIPQSFILHIDLDTMQILHSFKSTEMSNPFSKFSLDFYPGDQKVYIFDLNSDWQIQITRAEYDNFEALLDETTYEQVDFELKKDETKIHFVYTNSGDFAIEKVNKASFMYFHWEYPWT